MRRLGAAAPVETRVYLTGGASAVLMGWRESTVDVDLRMMPESDPLFRAISGLKEELNLNVELASPPDFIPALPDWESRSLPIAREGRVDWRHFDFYSQALAKIERGHRQDLEDARLMLTEGLVEPLKLIDFLGRIEPELIRYPAIDAATFAEKVKEFLAGRSGQGG